MCSDSPDYSDLANASKESAQIMADLGYAQLDFNKQQFEEAKPIFNEIVQSDLATQQETREQANDYYNYMKETYRPVETALASEASKPSEMLQEEYAGRAKADAQAALENSRQQKMRTLAAMGVNPNSGRFASSAGSDSVAEAAVLADATNKGRVQGENISYARKLDVAGLGRGLTGASQGAYGVSIAAGDAAGRGQVSPWQTAVAGQAQGANTIAQGRQLIQSGLGNVLNAEVAGDSGNKEMWGTLAGGAMMAGAMMSDRRLKENIKAVGETVHGLTLYEFSYIDDLAGKRYRGVMADEVSRIMPDAVEYDDYGYASVDYDMLGIAMEEV